MAGAVNSPAFGLGLKITLQGDLNVSFGKAYILIAELWLGQFTGVRRGLRSPSLRSSKCNQMRRKSIHSDSGNMAGAIH